jgi:hypothetical protein
MVNGEIQEMKSEGIEDSFQTETLPLPNAGISLWKKYLFVHSTEMTKEQLFSIPGNLMSSRRKKPTFYKSCLCLYKM